MQRQTKKLRPRKAMMTKEVGLVMASPTGVDGLETVCRHLLLDNANDSTERKQCHSLLDWLILRCNHQWQSMNLVGPATREVLVEEVLEIMKAVKDDVTDDDMAEELEKRNTRPHASVQFSCRFLSLILSFLLIDLPYTILSFCFAFFFYLSSTVYCLRPC